MWGGDMIGAIENDTKILYKKTHKKAKMPKYSKVGDSGADLFAVEDFVVRPGQIVLAKTGICIAMNKYIEAQIRPRSGLALKGLSIVNSPGTIDSGYRGEIKVALINLGKEELKFKVGDKFAQMVFAPVLRGHFIETKKLDETDRNSGGFGHTG